MIKAALILISLTLVVGCSQYRTLAGDAGRKASDAALHDAIWVVCDASTEGAVRRLFDNKEERGVYDTFCNMANK